MEDAYKGVIWEAKPSSPQYVPVRTSDVFQTVKNKWQSLGSPEAQCPVGQFGAAGSVENEACKARVAPLWGRFESVFPKIPSTGPYNDLVDLVSVSEVCSLGYSADPEADIGPVPNLFSNPGALSQKLQEWYLRSLIPTYCRIVPKSAVSGDCYCWPYGIKALVRTKRLGFEEFDPPFEVNGVAFGPIGAVSVSVLPVEGESYYQYLVSVEGAANDGGIRNGTISTCRVGRQLYSFAGGSPYLDAELLEVISVVPLSAEDVAINGWGYPSSQPSVDGFCPMPSYVPPLPPMPNTRGVYMPLPVPIISFPVAPGCPVQEDNLNITINLGELESIPGPPGKDGEPGRGGDAMISTIVRKLPENVIYDRQGGQGNHGGVFAMDRDSAYVRVNFNVEGATQGNYKGRRIYFQHPDTYENRKEIGLGNAYLRLRDTDNATLERIVLSMEKTLIKLPPSVAGNSWQLVINDKADVGLSITDLGYRHVVRRISNPDDVPEVEYLED